MTNNANKEVIDFSKNGKFILRIMPECLHEIQSHKQLFFACVFNVK